MRLPSSPFGPLHHCSPLYEITLKISQHLLLAAVLSLLLPVAESQMNLTEENSTFTQAKEMNEDKVIRETVKAVESKEYQTLLDRSRRKNYSSIEVKVNYEVEGNKYIEEDQSSKTNRNREVINATDYLMDKEYKDRDVIMTNDLNSENNSIEKLRIDDSDRNKIYHDYSIAMEKNLLNSEQINATGDFILSDDLLESFFNESIVSNNFTMTQENETDILNERDIVRENISNIPSEISLSNKKPPQSPRPSFIKGKFDNKSLVISIILSPKYLYLTQCVVILKVLWNIIKHPSNFQTESLIEKNNQSLIEKKYRNVNL